MQYKRTPQFKKDATKRARLYALLVKATNKELKNRDVNLTYPELRSIVSKYIYPHFKGRAASGVKASEVSEQVRRLLELLRENKYFHPLKIPIGLVQYIDWFNLDDFLTGELTSFVSPKDLRVRISAGQYGDTGEFDLQNYEYESQGLQDIIEEIRAEVDNISGAEWNAVAAVRPKKSDDGLIDSYQLRFILYIDSAPVVSEEEQQASDFEVSEEEADSAKIQARAKQLLKAGKRKDVEKIKRAKKRPRPKTKEGAEKKNMPPETQTKATMEQRMKIAQLKTKAMEARAKEFEVLRQDYKDGMYTKAQYEKERMKIIKFYAAQMKSFSKGGEV